MTKSRGILAPRQRWTEQEHDILRDIYPDVPCADVAALLGRKLSSVYQAAARLNLQKSAHFNALDISGRVRRGYQDPRMIASRFQPGIVPWNKGTHYVAGGRSAETRFKKGSFPHTTMTVGSYRTVTEKSGRKHLEQKTSERKGSNDKRWTPVSRLVWEAAHGPVPEGWVVVFKSGMHTLELEQITLDRIECITRKQLADRNHPNRSNPELAKLIQLRGAITRQVNRINREHQEQPAP